MGQRHFRGVVLHSLVSLLVAGAVLLVPHASRAQMVSTVAGSGAPGSADGTGTTATFFNPTSIAVDNAGNLYVADQSSNKIRKISPGGTVKTLAGSGRSGSLDGLGGAASFSSLTGVAIDKAGVVYVADYGNNLIRKVTPSGLVSTLAGSGAAGNVDGNLAVSSFNSPAGLAVDDAGNIFVADQGNNKIRKITTSGYVTTLAGSGNSGGVDGKGAAASFDTPTGVAVDDAGNVYVADQGNNKIRKVTPGGVVTTLAGSGTFWFSDGASDEASFNAPTSVAVDGARNVWVADEGNNKIRLITPDRFVKTLAGSGQAGGTDGDGPSATFAWPTGVAVDGAGNVYVADQAGNRIRKITAAPSDVCSPDAVSLCLYDGRFRLQADYRDHSGNSGQGKAVAVSSDSGYFWFFNKENMEVTAKVVSFCDGASGNFAFYASGMTDVEVTLKLTDMKTGAHQEYGKTLGTPFCTIADGLVGCP